MFLDAQRRPLVIGMLHVPALPGNPGCDSDLGAIREHVLRDADRLAHAGVDGLLLENFGDIPFFPGRVGAETVAQLTMLACAIRAAHAAVPLGINVLRNDGLSALAVAHASGAAFIRVNVLCGARVTDQGVLQGIAHDLLRLRKTLGADAIQILADVDVKHSAPLGPGRTVEVEVDDLVHRALADALIVSGTGTGKAADPQKVAVVRAAAARTVPVFVGSGVTEENLADFADHADGFIVGTSLKEREEHGGENGGGGGNGGGCRAMRSMPDAHADLWKQRTPSDAVEPSVFPTRHPEALSFPFQQCRGNKRTPRIPRTRIADMSAKAMIRTALAIDGLRGDARAAFDLAASERYHGIAFATNHAELTPDELDQSGRRHLKKILAAKHLAIDAIRAAAPRAGLADPATIDRTIENARKAILLAHDLGVETVALHLGNLADARTPIDTLVAAIRELSQHADAANMTLAFSSDVAGPLAKILKQVDYERARVNLDTARLIGAGEDPLILAEELAGSIGQVTAADAVRGGGGGGGSERGGTSSVHATFLGEGQLPLTEFMEILQEQGFAGPLVVDVRDLPESEEGARHAAEVLRKLMRELHS